ncbi:hypothetical protein [Paenibacillus mucilaginosus]|uniref:YkfB n=1 Tax=Paenibacillus mucilaginosus (strain KNP414) TaxID=1036673 RepID=F8FLL0_PAEMK|nr:hypothetical protein [Paenibacillus mucilaginosus]AEI44137.1 YkfB [Paenibacillus mucilaginosus KNP414]MCG7212392.1 hypothetical protein [Paenibacillus mucilaginosus]WDM25566.1 hypothetical protein KCX80_24345 [Paenibacillus mucilaginosus]
MIQCEVYAARQSVPLLRQLVTAQRMVHTAVSLLVRITSDNGRSGRGEAPAASAVTGDRLGDIESAVVDRLTPLLTGLGITAAGDPVRAEVDS